MTAKPPRVWSEAFPPRNRVPNDMGPVDAYVTGAGGVLYIPPNDAVVLAVRENLDLGGPVQPHQGSMLSGEPGYIYEDNEVRLVLTADELYRFLRCNLDADEYRKLREQFGLFYCIAPKYYDIDTGIALQPRFGPREDKTFFQRALRGDIEVEDFEKEMDAAVDAWHNGADGEVPLHRYLGMRQDEYSTWATAPGKLLKLLFVRLRDYETA
ncbi:hypothetical protein D3C71_18870 [compost metagenome]